MNELFETSVKPKALEALKRAVMPENPESKRKQTNVFLSELEKFRYAKNDKGETIVVDGNGEPVENRHGWPKTVDDAVSELFDHLFVDNGLPHTVDEAYKRLRNPNITSAERIHLTNWIGDNDLSDDRNVTVENLYAKLKDPNITAEERIRITNLIKRNGE